MDEKFVFILSAPTERQQALRCVAAAPEYYTVEVKPTKRTDDQNRKFHAMAGDIAKQVPWGGKMRTPAQWKTLLVSGHAMAAKEGAEVLPGLESEYVNLRESTALMSVKRGASLIEYSLAFGEMNGVKWSEPDARSS